mmetsp:Transcript_7564/g.17150  ORF Transcript_7564/g.17150 Transcript_7564/m.17150 type:complete len:486 (-) Transcript_7564:103-1560(-)|eukprot:CAMPEP_0198714348 /NCGR_PEP_ID=MMETSP1471-20131121/19776_1 /TAXON_ID=41880 /ORGANISM="Pycnococcus provasolii, Strain RCC733" /LENGTH=485 /DNA_ID=CAMNT_0044474635 /DNA_START=202 /DNA_END=1659 /DNA_ORIENTATION=-
MGINHANANGLPPPPPMPPTPAPDTINLPWLTWADVPCELREDVECAHAEHEASESPDEGGAALLRVVGIVREHTASAEHGTERAMRRMCRAFIALALRAVFPERRAHNPCFKRHHNNAVEWLVPPEWWPVRTCDACDGSGALRGELHPFRGTFAFDAPIEEVHALLSRLSVEVLPRVPHSDMQVGRLALSPAAQLVLREYEKSNNTSRAPAPIPAGRNGHVPPPPPAARRSSHGQGVPPPPPSRPRSKPGSATAASAARNTEPQPPAAPPGAPDVLPDVNGNGAIANGFAGTDGSADSNGDARALDVEVPTELRDIYERHRRWSADKKSHPVWGFFRMYELSKEPGAMSVTCVVCEQNERNFTNKHRKGWGNSNMSRHCNQAHRELYDKWCQFLESNLKQVSGNSNGNGNGSAAKGDPAVKSAATSAKSPGGTAPCANGNGNGVVPATKGGASATATAPAPAVAPPLAPASADEPAVKRARVDP